MPIVISNLQLEEIFVVGGDLALYHTWRPVNGGHWSAWHSLGGVVQQIALAYNKYEDHTLQVFGIGLDNHIYRIWQTNPSGEWSNWEQFWRSDESPAIGRKIVAINQGSDLLAAFAIGLDNQIYWNQQLPPQGFTSPPGGHWSGWHPIPSEPVEDIGIEIDPTLTLIATRKSDKMCMFNRFTGLEWTGWADVGAGPMDRFCVVRTPYPNMVFQLRILWLHAGTRRACDTVKTSNIWTTGYPNPEIVPYRSISGIETGNGVEMCLMDDEYRLYQQSFTGQSWSPRSELVLPTVDPSFLPPGGFQAFDGSHHSISSMRRIRSRSPQHELHLTKAEAKRGVGIGVLIFGALTGNPTAVLGGYLTAAAANEEVEKERAQPGQQPAPVLPEQPSPTPQQYKQGGCQREPKIIEGVDSSSSSRGEVSNIA